jgi:hypothetical protein
LTAATAGDKVLALGRRRAERGRIDMRRILMGAMVVALGLGTFGLASAEEGADKPAVEHFGGEFQGAEAVAFKALVEGSEKFDGKTVKVEATVRKVCKKKGCWMVIGDDAAPDQTIRIKMKDYSFFVPKDCDGQSATIEGVLSRKVVPEATLKHYAQDEGRDPSTIQGDQVELTLMAHAIDLRKAAK